MTARIEWDGHLAMEAFRRGAAAGLQDAADMVLRASNAAAPKETSHLVNSSGADVDPVGLEASVYYDPDSAPRGGRPIYAVVRHEALRQGGAPKYLERPLLRSRHAVAGRIAAHIQREL